MGDYNMLLEDKRNRDFYIIHIIICITQDDKLLDPDNS